MKQSTNMKIVNLQNQNSVLNAFVAEIRDKSIQKDPMRFRRNLERIGNIFAYEISKTLEYKPQNVVTPLGIAEIPLFENNIVISTILRAGVPLHTGILNVFDKAQCAFIAAYRKYDKGGGFKINIEYCTAPSLDGKVLILADTMLATGASIEVAYNRLCENGEPLCTHLVCPIASQYAVEYLKKTLYNKDVTLWTAGIDEELTTHSYIVPGLGDAGDLAYGSKL